VVDALSGRLHGSKEVFAISYASPGWLLSFQSSYEGDPFAADLISKLSLDSSPVLNYTWKDGLLRYKTRIWIGNNPGIHSQLVASLHNTLVGGHSRIPVACR
jgi:hypothetical protein